MKRSRNQFDPASSRPFRLSRSKIDLWLECPRCFYLDRRLHVQRPALPGFSLNNAVDQLLKREFDSHRAKQRAHEVMKKYGVEAVPFEHAELEAWRDSLRRGVTYTDPQTNLTITGGLDDVWVRRQGGESRKASPRDELIVVDYKATSTRREISLEDKYKQGYKRQMEVYQWLLRRNGFTVAPVGYFLFANASADKEAFDGKLEFEMTLIPYTGDDSWVEGTVRNIHACLMSEDIPERSETCEYCAYREAARAVGV